MFPCDPGDDELWRLVSDRVSADNERFVFGVVTTSIYCLPTCPARRPLRRNVRFFPNPAAAEIAGFRACLRCRPRQRAGMDDDRLSRVLTAVRALHAAGGPLPVDELARAVGWSPRQMHRRFVGALAVTPRAYGEALRLKAAKRALRTTPSVADAVFAAGYGSVRGFYEQTGLRLGVEPHRYAAGGAGEQLLWSAANSPIGAVLVVVSRRGVVAARIGGGDRALLAEVAAELPRALLVRDDDALRPVMAVVLRLAAGSAVARSLPLDVRGTAFQAAVWAALRTVPPGHTGSYAEVATLLERPAAVRAVARACAANPAALVVPCHRVIRGDGGLGGFRWGLRVKAALLAAEETTASALASA